ncbi:MAG: preprotein translocase subunit SecE [Candidatus Saganbacteria bacterium]|nr:preprotein translocase subunit SecE [Candidatus Saganbacteria bacterium]
MSEEKKVKSDIIKRIKTYLKETETEAKKVVWPDRKYVAAATVIILIIVFLSSAYVLLVDWGFAEMFKGLNYLIKPSF